MGNTFILVHIEVPSGRWTFITKKIITIKKKQRQILEPYPNNFKCCGVIASLS
jgi:hypothetical protein